MILLVFTDFLKTILPYFMDLCLSDDTDLQFTEEKNPMKLLVFRQHLTFENYGFISYMKNSFCRRTWYPKIKYCYGVSTSSRL